MKRKTVKVILPGTILGLLANCCLPPTPDPNEPPPKPTTLALVQQNLTGGIQLRYVRGEALGGSTTYIHHPQRVALPEQPTASATALGAPSAVRSGDQKRVFVARAVVDFQNQRTTIHVIDSSYATLMATAISRPVIERPVVVDSAVYLTQLNNEFLLIWREGSLLKVSRSADGASWSTVQNLITPGDVAFNLWSEGDRLYLAHTNTAADSITVKRSDDGVNFTDMMSFTPKSVPVNDLSIATDSARVLVAYASEKAIRVRCTAKSGVGRRDRIVISAPEQTPDYRLLDVSLHPSPYGWSLLYNASLPTPDGIAFTTFGRRSDDGLHYGTNSWWFYTGPIYTGRADMSLTPAPMPWITKVHDSGEDAGDTYNFVITGEGFRYEEKDLFANAAQTLTANILNRSPFFYNQGLFNIWIVNTFSIDAGFDSSETTDDKNTIFDSHRMDGTTYVRNRENAIQHAKRVIAGDEQSVSHLYGFILMNNSEDEPVAIPSWDVHGTPVPYRRANSLVLIHEYLHTHAGSGGFALGDHERRQQAANQVNKSFDSTLVAGGSHAWQPWFVFNGPAASRLMETTPQYKAGLLDWIANGNEKWQYHRSAFAYSEDPSSPYYVDALSLLNVGLWESELSDVEDFSLYPQYSALRACAMNSLLHHAQIFCPICSQSILAHLAQASGETFDIAAFQSASGAQVEFQAVNSSICGQDAISNGIDLEGLLSVNGNDIPLSDISCYDSHDLGYLFRVCRADISALVSTGQTATVAFRQRPAGSGDTRLWLPGLQIVNARGARYPMQPAAQPVVDRLHQKHAPECDYEFWNLEEGDLLLSFEPN